MEKSSAEERGNKEASTWSTNVQLLDAPPTTGFTIKGQFSLYQKMLNNEESGYNL